ncbi:phage tail tape measure protein [Tepidimicrobium xylanilyticum]|uniref:Phage tail tape measure protein, TP901 family, core region n=1 Tax=Tepidimicrobium xylanilyticum TaxID=1123352 RepID=A0A1H3EM43_9FIRM|nr:phage tail tape measure protein [Tepidimicrobium xylanilyticum]SDX79009.1 phage tail tape measure protein, TP901 family, core region [Tepidimicrobium xylanilyticum]
MQENRVRVIFEAVLGKFKNDVKSAAKATLEIGEAGEKASEQVDFDEANKSVKALEVSLKRLTATLKKLAVGYVAKKLFGAGKDNFMYFVDYQKSLAQVTTLLPHITEDRINQMSENVKRLARDMKILPQEIFPAMYSAISASVPEEEMFDFLETARRASIGGVTDMLTSVDVLTSVVNAYGSEVIDAQKASDLIFTTMRKGKTTFEEITSQLYSVLPAAKALEVPFENVSAAIATLTATGTPTAQATTQIGRMFLEFSKQGTRASEVFRAATGKTFRQFIAEGHNLQDALTVMEQVAKKAKVEINDLFNSAEAGNAALSLTGKSASRFTEDLEAMANAAGATKEAFDKMSGTISYALEGIRAKISVFKINIAEKYFPEIRDAINAVDETLDRLDENKALDSLARSIGGIIATIILKFNDMLTNIDSVIERINKLAYFIDNNLSTAIDVVMGLAKAFIIFKTAAAVAHVIETVAGAIGLLTKAQWALNAAQNASPIGFIITLAGLLLLWIIKLIGGFENLENIGTRALLALRVVFLMLVEKIVWGVNLILQFLKILLGWIPIIGDVIGVAANTSSRALKGLRSEIDETIDKLDELSNKKTRVDIEAENDALDEELFNSLEGRGTKDEETEEEQPHEIDVQVPDDIEELISGKGSARSKKTL